MRELPNLKLAYSIKTDPDPNLLRLACEAGLLAEAISQHEVDAALRCGFEAHRVVLNGPAKFWPTRQAYEAGAVFADSIDDLRRMLRVTWVGETILGVRIGFRDWNSRFGIDLESPDVFSETVSLLRGHLRNGGKWGFHMHYAPNDGRGDAWQNMARQVLAVGQRLSEALNLPPHTIDFGGGWRPNEGRQMMRSVRTVLSEFPDLQANEVILEPGKMLAQECGSVLSRVIGIRGKDVIIDASVAEVPEATWWPHPLQVLENQNWSSIRPGSSRVLGRTCMEHDVIATNIETSDLNLGDLLAVRMTGAYDRSMAYTFAQAGQSCDALYL